jgi:hypothetical protein
MDEDVDQKFQPRREENERMEARICSILSHLNGAPYIDNNLEQL